MVICIELSQRTKQELDKLLEVGKYHDYSEAVSTAISNQLVLHKRVSKEKAFLFQSKSEPSAALESHVVNAVDAIEIPKAQKPMFSVPGIFHWSPLLYENTVPETAPFPDDAFVPGQSVPVDRWIFGQHNKLLPVKASCRALAFMMHEPENASLGVLLPKAAAEIAEEAVKLGDYLHFWDEKFEVNRDDAFSIAFPFSGAESEDKARLRFSNQFVASISKQGRLTGLLVDLKLVNHAKSKAPKILLTSAGWNFARLRNPLLDSTPNDNHPDKLCEEEKTFLTNHIRDQVPSEHSAYRTILQAVLNGEDTPEKLDSVLRKHLSARPDRPFTDAFVTTQRSGAISRMADLGLIERHRDGIRVAYVVTGKGNEFLKMRLERGSHE